MRSWGVTCLIVGIGSFILPQFGMQFCLVSWAGSAAPIIGGLFIVMGLVLLFSGRSVG